MVRRGCRQVFVLGQGRSPHLQYFSCLIYEQIGNSALFAVFANMVCLKMSLQSLRSSMRVKECRCVVLDRFATISKDTRSTELYKDSLLQSEQKFSCQ